MDQQQRNFLGLLSATLSGDSFVPEETDFSKILRYAQDHSLANLLSYSIAKLPPHERPDEDLFQYLKKVSYSTAVRESVQREELQELSKAFENNNIRALLLKGAIVKHYYPKAEYRYMSDIDILIDPSQSAQVRDCFLSLGWKQLQSDGEKTDYYVSGFHIKYEVHKDIRSESFNKKTADFSANLFSAAPGKESGFAALPFEEHYAYILCHFVKHLLYGGIGVRQVMDIYICRKNWSFDEEKLSSLLKELGLDSFATTLEKLAFFWFGGGEGDEITEELGQYILQSGVFGSEEHKVADRMLKEQNGKTKFSYMFTRLFPNYKTMCFYYPILKKWAVLLPFFWVWRMIYALIFRRGKLRKEIAVVGETNQEALQQRASFYQRCGLKVYTKQ